MQKTIMEHKDNGYAGGVFNRYHILKVKTWWNFWYLAKLFLIPVFYRLTLNNWGKNVTICCGQKLLPYWSIDRYL